MKSKGLYLAIIQFLHKKENKNLSKSPYSQATTVYILVILALCFSVYAHVDL